MPKVICKKQSLTTIFAVTVLPLWMAILILNLLYNLLYRPVRQLVRITIFKLKYLYK